MEKTNKQVNLAVIEVFWGYNVSNFTHAGFVKICHNCCSCRCFSMTLSSETGDYVKVQTLTGNT